MSASAPTSYNAYTGIWINWSYGRIRGSTLTLSQQDAQLLIAFVAFFIAFVSMHLWKILCFILHSCLSTTERRDILHHQRQAIIRNSPSPGSTALKLMQLAWAWRKSTRAYRRVLPFFGSAILISSMLAAATGFSSRLAYGDDNEILLNGDNCGTPWVQPNETAAIANLYSYQAEMASSALNYASQCYANNASILSACSTFVQPRLSITESRDTVCPFGSLCKDNRTSIHLDSGIIDSHKDLGINSPESDRFTLRATWDCAPLTTEGRKSTVMVEGVWPYIGYNYSVATPYRSNITYMTANDTRSDWYVNVDYNAATPTLDHKLSTVWAFVGSPDTVSVNAFNPLPELASEDADTYLVFLSSPGVQFMDRTLDPWYQATTPFGVRVDYNDTSRVDLFEKDDPASVLACFSRYQWCNPSLSAAGQCREPTAFNQALMQALDYGTDQLDPESATWIFSRFGIDPKHATSPLGSRSLLSRRTLTDGVQAPLPNDQWQMDVRNWFEIALAGLQRSWVSMAAGDTIHMKEENVKRPISNREHQWCQNQKVKSTAYVSFTVLGLSLVLGLGIIIVVISLTIESINGFIQRRFKQNPYKLLEWGTNGYLQLQRLALEEAHIGDWSGCDKNVPYTKLRTEVDPLDVTDIRHPRMPVPWKRRGEEPSIKDSTETAVVDVNVSDTRAPDVSQRYSRIQPSTASSKSSVNGSGDTLSVSKPVISDFQSNTASQSLSRRAQAREDDNVSPISTVAVESALYPSGADNL